MEAKTLILFVHGFMGSESSFSDFPLDLVLTIKKTYKLPNIEARIFPFFATKGSPNKSIALLYNWLLLNASAPEYEAVVIVAHSMGGLISCDAFRRIIELIKRSSNDNLHNQKEFKVASADIELSNLPTMESTEDHQKSWIGGSSNQQVAVADDSLSSMAVDEDSQNRNTEIASTFEKVVKLDTKVQVNIISIICFDSPFYGLNSNVFKIAAGEAAADIISSYVPESHSLTVKNAIVQGTTLATSAVAKSVSVAASLPQVGYDIVTSIPQTSVNVVKAIPQTSVSIVKSIPEGTTYAVKSAVSALPTIGNVIGQSITIPTYAVASGISMVNNSIRVYFSGASKGNAGESNNEKEPLDQCNSVNVDELEITEEANIIKESYSEQIDTISKRETELAPIPKGSDWSNVIGIGLTSAAIACGAYYYTGSLIAIGSVSIIRRAAMAYAVSHAEEARQHLQFLYPIWGESVKDSEDRIDSIIESTADGLFSFKCYYIQIQKEDEKASRTFIKPPSPDSKGKNLFCPIGTDFDNEIIAHMSLFSRADNPGHYWVSVQNVAKDIRNSILAFRSFNKQ
jgi:hypothetical protein